MGAGLRTGAKATDMPPDPTVGAPAPDSTEVAGAGVVGSDGQDVIKEGLAMPFLPAVGALEIGNHELRDGSQKAEKKSLFCAHGPLLLALAAYGPGAREMLHLHRILRQEKEGAGRTVLNIGTYSRWNWGRQGGWIGSHGSAAD